MVITKKDKDLKPVLMDSRVRPIIKEPYSLIIEENQVIFVISPGQNGIEYNKTEGYFSSYPGVQVYQCLYGQGVLLMQRNDELGEAKEFKVLTLNPGRQIGVPADWGMSLVNIGKTFLVVIGNLDVTSKFIDSKAIIEKSGLAYFVVEKKGEVGFEKNSNYENHPQITTE